MKNNNTTIVLWVCIITLLCMVSIAFYILINLNKINAKPVQVKSWIKQRESGLVTVMDSQENILCTFYDSAGGIGCKCPDTVFVYPSKR